MKEIFQFSFLIFFLFSPTSNVDGGTPIEGSFTKEMVMRKYETLAELLPNGTRSFRYWYFDKLYDITIDIPLDVDGITGYHVCSDLMLTMFLKDKSENVWQCDLPGYIPNPILFECQLLENVKRVNCTNRHAKFIHVKTSETPKTKTEMASSFTIVLLCFIALLLFAIFILLIIIVVLKFKKKATFEFDVEKHGPTSPPPNRHESRNQESNHLLPNGETRTPQVSSSDQQLSNPHESSEETLTNSETAEETESNEANGTLLKKKERKKNAFHYIFRRARNP